MDGWMKEELKNSYNIKKTGKNLPMELRTKAYIEKEREDI